MKLSTLFSLLECYNAFALKYTWHFAVLVAHESKIRECYKAYNTK
jgi:hypothetical protein